MTNIIRNITIIAHVDHGKTTLIDNLMKQSGTFRENENVEERVMDSGELEKERGITILAKPTSINWKDSRINIIDTPGHRDFAAEVERVLHMADGALLLIDSAEGVMPQTKFVLSKALKQGLKPIVVINKLDKPDQRANEVLDETFDLFVSLDANEEQLDFPVLYASGRSGWATQEINGPRENLQPLLNLIIKHVKPSTFDKTKPFAMLSTLLYADSFLGRSLVGRIAQGTAKASQQIKAINLKGKKVDEGRLTKIFRYEGTKKVPIEQGEAGDIVIIAGLEKANVADTICDLSVNNPIDATPIDPPTMSITITVNSSPLAGTEGKKLTSTQIRDRLILEAENNVGINFEENENKDAFIISGRGELMLEILLTQMRREGFEIGVSSPDVIYKTIDGQKCEPFEDLILDIQEQYQGVVIEKLGERKAQLINLTPFENNKLRLNYEIPTRGLIGFRSEFLTLTSGTGIINHTFKEYKPCVININRNRKNGALISMSQGKAVPYALFNLQERGKLIIPSNIEVYEGMIVGENPRTEDLPVNPTKAKHVTNHRAAGSDKSEALTPAIKFSLERAIEYIAPDELVEVTPKSIRLRKKILDFTIRKREAKKLAS